MSKRVIKEPVQFESMVPKIVKKSITTGKTVQELDFKNMVKLSKHASEQENLIDNIREIFPDIELAIELVTSLITTPNDMSKTNLIYSMDKFTLPTEIQSGILGIIDNYVDTTYNIKDKVDEIVEESLFTKGAYVELNIPPSNINEMLTKAKSNVKAGVEDILMNSIGLMGVYKDNVMSISSNPSVLLKDEIEEIQTSIALETTLSDGLSPGLEALMVSDSGYGIMDETDISNDKPIIKKMSSTKVIPIVNSENPNKHYGYFIILNESGKKRKGSSRVKDSDNELINKVNTSLKSMTSKAPVLGDISDLREELVNNKLKKFIGKNLKTDLSKIEFDIDDDLLLDMADDIIHKSTINVLFVPTSLVSYYAINFRDNGMGESLLERLTVLMSMRAILLFTKLLSYIKSSVTTTDVKVDLDPDDPEYRKSMNAIMAEVIKNRQVSMPIGILNTDDLADWAHKLGFSFNFKHPGLPDVNIDIEEKANEINPIDDSLKEDIDKLIITSLYLTPEMIDNTYSPDFATIAVANNALLRKRINKLQNKYNILITKDVRKKLKVDGRFKSNLITYIKPAIKKIKSHIIKNNSSLNVEAIKKASDEDLIEFVCIKIIDNIRVNLPVLETVESTNEADMVSNYTDLLDNVVDKLFSSNLIPSDYIGMLGDNLDDMKSLIKHTMLRRYIGDNNILPEFTKMFTLDEDGKPMFNLLTDFNTFNVALDSIITPFLKENKKLVEKLDKKQSKLSDGGDSGYSEDDDYGNDNGDSTEGDEPTDGDEPSLEGEPDLEGEPTEDNGDTGDVTADDDNGEADDGGDEPTENGEPTLEGEPTEDNI
jgi:hypothetical protein